jgi:hypothetical protein
MDWQCGSSVRAALQVQDPKFKLHTHLPAEEEEAQEIYSPMKPQGEVATCRETGPHQLLTMPATPSRCLWEFMGTVRYKFVLFLSHQFMVSCYSNLNGLRWYIITILWPTENIHLFLTISCPVYCWHATRNQHHFSVGYFRSNGAFLVWPTRTIHPFSTSASTLASPGNPYSPASFTPQPLPVSSSSMLPKSFSVFIFWLLQPDSKLQEGRNFTMLWCVSTF